jgi:hypothetical protein
VVYKDGTSVTEEETTWNKVHKGNIKLVGLKWHDRFWTIPDKTAYVPPFKRGTVSFSTSGVVLQELPCIERCIGYYEGASKVIYRVNELTGRMRMEVK